MFLKKLCVYYTLKHILWIHIHENIIKHQLIHKIVWHTNHLKTTRIMTWNRDFFFNSIISGDLKLNVTVKISIWVNKKNKIKFERWLDEIIFTNWNVINFERSKSSVLFLSLKSESLSIVHVLIVKIYSLVAMVPMMNMTIYY